MYTEYIYVECREQIMSISDFAKLPNIRKNLPSVYIDDDYDYYDCVLTNMYTNYVTPIIYYADSNPYKSPLFLFPQSCYLHMQCTKATATMSISLYNEDQYLLYETTLNGYELVDNWKSDGTQIILNLIEHIKNIDDRLSSKYRYISFNFITGFLLTKEILLEYDSKPTEAIICK